MMEAGAERACTQTTARAGWGGKRWMQAGGVCDGCECARRVLFAKESPLNAEGRDLRREAVKAAAEAQPR